MKNEQKKIFNISIISYIAVQTILILVGLIFLVIHLASRKTWDENGALVSMSAGNIAMIYILFILGFLIIAVLQAGYVIMMMLEKEGQLKKLIFSILLLNVVGIVYSSFEIKEWNSNIGYLKPKKWTIYEMCYVGLLLSLYLLVNFISGYIPPMPFWITISFKYIFLYVGAYLLNFWACLTLCVLAASLTAVMPGTAVLSPVQYLFDYWFVTVSFALASLFKPADNIKNKYVEAANYITFITIPMICVYVSRVLSGVLFWLNPKVYTSVYYDFEWNGAWTYSMIFNAFNTIFDYATLLILVPPTCKVMKIVKDRQTSWNKVR
ncbi:hypothetical protein SCHIN_v1c03940 [Spiroplasma chinense]|uniref:Thiamine transporter n=1 Tax=Spiroplasma chinense TaxID=216932 RepID=A0A5B9Y3K3_9MOLU|nr:energy-coupled thiamine transporter ThiT [Spiroplasma chinense]QEH61591.1 hypothetical protein SCHIN_v1c03940 [Spiroplasma chinense]